MNRKQMVCSISVGICLSVSSLVFARIVELTLEDRLFQDTFVLGIERDLLHGLRLPRSQNEQQLLINQVQNEGLVGCHQWLYPERTEFWELGPTWKSVQGTEAVENCQKMIERLSQIRQEDIAERTFHKRRRWAF